MLFRIMLHCHCIAEGDNIIDKKLSDIRACFNFIPATQQSLVSSHLHNTHRTHTFNSKKDLKSSGTP